MKPTYESKFKMLTGSISILLKMPSIVRGVDKAWLVTVFDKKGNDILKVKIYTFSAVSVVVFLEVYTFSARNIHVSLWGGSSLDYPTPLQFKMWHSHALNMRNSIRMNLVN